MSAAFSALYRIAQDEPDPSVRTEAIVALGSLAIPSDLPRLVALMVSPKDTEDRASVERAVLMVFGKVDDPNAQARPVLEALENAPDGAKPGLIGLLSRPATAGALAAVRSAMESGPVEVRDAAIRTLGDWPTAEPIGDLYRIAVESPDAARRALALRSYVRMASLREDSTAVSARALKIAKDENETRLVLSGLGQCDTLEALEMAERYLDVEVLKAEAQLAVVQVAGQYGWQDPGRARESLNRVTELTGNDAVRRQARDAVRRMEEYHDTINAWLGCGPFKLEDVHDGRKVFDTPFAPETDPGAVDLRWVTVRSIFEGDRRINLEDTFGREDYCSAYVRTFVISPRRQAARIEWSVDDYLKGWLNGQLIEGREVTLQEGANTLMLKVGDHGGGWNFNCRLLTPEGHPMEGLRYAPRLALGSE